MCLQYHSHLQYDVEVLEMLSNREKNDNLHIYGIHVGKY